MLCYRGEGDRGWMEEMRSAWPLNPSSGTMAGSAQHSSPWSPWWSLRMDGSCTLRSCVTLAQVFSCLFYISLPDSSQALQRIPHCNEEHILGPLKQPPTAPFHPSCWAHSFSIFPLPLPPPPPRLSPDQLASWCFLRLFPFFSCFLSAVWPGSDIRNSSVSYTRRKHVCADSAFMLIE